MLCITSLFVDVDNFCLEFEPIWNQCLISDKSKKRNKKSMLCLSEIVTIIILFHSSNYRTFKHFYIDFVMLNFNKAFPHLVSYNRFVELMAGSLPCLCCYLNTRKGKVTGISFIDSTTLIVCHNRRIHSHKVFKEYAKRGKNSIGWFYGFKLHLIINEEGELLAFKVTAGNTDDRKPVLNLVNNIFGKLFGDKGYISEKLTVALLKKGVHLITKIKKNMKNKLILLSDKIILRKRSIIETVNDQLKNISQIEHTRHRSIMNFMVNIIAGLIAYTWQSKKPSLNLYNKIENEIIISY